MGRRILLPTIVIGIVWTILAAASHGVHTALYYGFERLDTGASWLSLSAAIAYALAVTGPFLLIPIMASAFLGNLLASAVVAGLVLRSRARSWLFALIYTGVLGLVYVPL